MKITTATRSLGREEMERREDASIRDFVMACPTETTDANGIMNSAGDRPPTPGATQKQAQNIWTELVQNMLDVAKTRTV